MVSEVKQTLDSTGIRIAGWLITGTVIVIGVAFLYTKFLEARKLRVDYLISQYELNKSIKEDPEFSPIKTGVSDQIKSLKLKV